MKNIFFKILISVTIALILLISIIQLISNNLKICVYSTQVGGIKLRIIEKDLGGLGGWRGIEINGELVAYYDYGAPIWVMEKEDSLLIYDIIKPSGLDTLKLIGLITFHHIRDNAQKRKMLNYPPFKLIKGSQVQE